MLMNVETKDFVNSVNAWIPMEISIANVMKDMNRLLMEKDAKVGIDHGTSSSCEDNSKFSAMSISNPKPPSKFSVTSAKIYFTNGPKEQQRIFSLLAFSNSEMQALK